MAALVSSFAGPAVADEVAHVARAITGKSIKNNSVTGRDVKNASLSGKDLSSKARAALRGATGPPGPAGPAGGVTPIEGPRRIGASGQPAFQNNYSQATGYRAPAFFKDRDGIVHLEGSLQNPSPVEGSPAFILPVGYRPDARIQFETHTYQQTGTIEVLANGEVRVLGDTRFGAMDGMEFRASQ
jgi:hypothetical protein